MVEVRSFWVHTLLVGWYNGLVMHVRHHNALYVCAIATFDLQYLQKQILQGNLVLDFVLTIARVSRPRVNPSHSTASSIFPHEVAVLVVLCPFILGSDIVPHAAGSSLLAQCQAFRLAAHNHGLLAISLDGITLWVYLQIYILFYKGTVTCNNIA